MYPNIITILFFIYHSYCLDSKSSLRLDGRLTKVCLRYVPDDRLNLATFVEETAVDEDDDGGETPQLNDARSNSQDPTPPLSTARASGGHKRALDQDMPKTTSAIGMGSGESSTTATTKRRKGQPVKKGSTLHFFIRYCEAISNNVCSL